MLTHTRALTHIDLFPEVLRNLAADDTQAGIWDLRHDAGEGWSFPASKHKV